jgi:tRNA threonylcarbamoyl adenosine modification protein (Sua5/YciO/YrdC/YwlC family)
MLMERETVKAVLLPATKENLETCGKRIRDGLLVAFPTETVYGLGADATNEKAVSSIFAAKERPFTDPVIVHIADLQFVDRCFADGKEKDFIREVGALLWPGPLTLIGPVNEAYIPRMVGSNTGSIGVRFPSNRIAQELIRAAGTPIAAPSANKFMHVSPTKGSHVFDDLKFEDVHILDDEMSDLGVESTVVKVDWQAENYRVTLLRTGTFDFKAVQEKIASLPKYRNVEFVVNKKRVANSEHESACAPGQLLKHYSPYVQTFLISQIPKEQAESRGMTLMSSEGVKFGVIDFHRTNLRLQASSGFYTDLDQNGDFKAAMKSLYNELRRAESPEHGLSFIFLVNLQRLVDENELPLNTLADKTYRSASGVEIFYDEHLNFYSQPA